MGIGLGFSAGAKSIVERLRETWKSKTSLHAPRSLSEQDLSWTSMISNAETLASRPFPLAPTPARATTPAPGPAGTSRQSVEYHLDQAAPASPESLTDVVCAQGAG